MTNLENQLLNSYQKLYVTAENMSCIHIKQLMLRVSEIRIALFILVKEFLPLGGWFSHTSEDHRYFEAMGLEGQQILSESFPVLLFTIAWELGMPGLKLDFQSRSWSQENFSLHTWSFFPFIILQLHIWVNDHCIRQADHEQKVGVQFVFLVSLTKISQVTNRMRDLKSSLKCVSFGEKDLKSNYRYLRVLRICLMGADA